MYAPQNITTVNRCICYRKICSLAGLLPQHVVLQPSWPLITQTKICVMQSRTVRVFIHT